jgi:hypothetical protein
MNTKLYKTEKENYILVDPSKGTYDVGYLLGTSRDSQVNKLSIKNCQAIERGYDLVDIKKKIFNGFDGCPDSFTLAAVERTIEVMMELMGNKKFSEDDVISIIEKSRKTGLTSQYLILANQQTEWDVEIVEECLDKNCDGINKKGECITTGKPKLDKEGCLILKKL